MLSNCEKIVLLPSSTTNAWPLQPQDVDEIDEKKPLFMASTNTPSSMEKHQQQPQLQSPQQQQQQQQQPQQPLRCPRCDSSNTKFCYYNNYSLSQPRHFCKACKRYWTRGGTLRNVPVGGGCRKNKRSKRLASASDSGASSTTSASLNTPPPSVQASVEIGSRSSHLSTLFYGALPSNPSEINVSYPNLIPSYDLPPHLNALGLGFSSSGYENSYRNGFSTGNLSSIQDLLPPNSLLSNYNSIFGCSTSSTTTIPSMTSLIASSVGQQQKFINGAHQKDTRTPSLGSFQPLSTFEELQAAVRKGEVGLGMKPVKLEDAQNRLDWNQTYGENPIDQARLSDPSSSSWSMANSVGPWHDQGSIGSSVPSLI